MDVTERLAEQPENLLDHLVAEFTDGRGRAVRFHRYLLARSVLVQEIDPPEPLLIRDRVDGVLRETWRADNLPNVIAILTGAVMELHGLPGMGIQDGITRITRGVFRSDAARAIVRRPRATWFAGNKLLEGPGNETVGLARLWEWCHLDNWELRRRADYVLAAAFLADIRESAEKGSWHGNYAIALDNADATSAAVHLVRALAHVLEAQDRATISVTHRGGLHAEIGAVVGGEAVVDPMKIPAADADSAGSPPDGTRWWPLRLPDLDEAGMRDMLRNATSWNEPTRARVANAVYKLTRGHMGTTTDVCRRLAGQPQPAAEHIDLASLFDAGKLIRRLTGPLDQGAQSALEMCSAVRDHDHVGVLFGDRDGGPPAAVHRAELWVPGRAGRLVLLPVLRRFLLRRFAGRPADAPDGWNTIFSRLAEHARDGESEESELYYRLALGETEAVTRHLYERLSRGDPAEWIELHKHVTLAPGRFGDDPYSAVLARHKKWAAGEDRPMRALADLVVRLWLAADPFSEPKFRDDLENAIRDAIRRDYEELADRFPAAEPLLRLEAARWS
ncbi:MAG TPA: hypothetical protein VE465_22945 [Streptosporangiaceae bacterium]|nr:hypothetical protein [Streptosporangiaceae bacterium]